MSTKTFPETEPTQEELVADFLKRLPSMRSKKTPIAKPWKSIIGTAKNDEVEAEAARLGEEWRARMNKSKFG